MKAEIYEFIADRAIIYRQILNSEAFIEQITSALELINNTINFGGKILIFGNGGSAAEAQHFAAELVCMFEKKRRAIAAIALTTDSSILTAQSNDFGFQTIFSRQIEALCRPDDLVIGLTTSDANDDGHSADILNAFLTAGRITSKSIGLFSQKTQRLLPLVSARIIVPATNTALIQEVHQTIIHMLCSLIERDL